MGARGLSHRMWVYVLAGGLVLSACTASPTNVETSGTATTDVDRRASTTSSGALSEQSATSLVEGGGPLAGSWEEAPTSLGSSELVPTLVPVDDRLFILFTRNTGGDIAGEIYESATGIATPMAPSGQVWRHQPAVAWTGTELLIVGGTNGPGIDDLVLAYEPEADEWRTLNNPPGDFDPWENRISGPAVWSGDELLVWQAGLAFDPVADNWRDLAPYPGPRRGYATTVWTGQEIIVWGGCDTSVSGQCDDAEVGLLTDGMIYDVAADTWRMMAPSPLAAGVHPVGVWADDAALFYAGKTDADRDGVQVARYNPTTDEWTEFDAPPIEPRRYVAGAWTGQHFVLWGGTLAGDGAVLDINTGVWTALPDPPTGSERDRHTMVWIEDRLYIVGGARTNGPITFKPE